MSATYYIDYARGADTNNGTSMETPFKHAPGDPAAEGTVKGLKLKPGDTVIFKGGVHYRGWFEIDCSGTKEKQIVFDGNTAGAFGRGQAVLDGSQDLTGWKKCASADDCGGNPHWKNIWRTTAPAGATAWSAGLLQDETLLGIAQYPTPADYSFNDQTREFKKMPPAAFTETSVTDPFLKALGGEKLVGAYVQVWRTTNRVDVRKIKGWDEKNSTITFSKLDTPPYTDQDGCYAIVNALHGKVLDREGEFVLDETPLADGSLPVYLWPLDGKDPNTAQITVSMQSTAIIIRKARHYITIQGFKIQKYRQAITNQYGDWNTKEDEGKALVIRNNLFTKIRQQNYGNLVYLVCTSGLLVEGNRLEYNPKQRGIAVHTSLNAMVRDNTLHKVGRTPIVFYYGTNGTIRNNRVTDCRGTHSNGISVYAHCKDMLVEGNTVWNSNVSLTCNETENIVFRNNIFDGMKRAQPMAFWVGVTGKVVLENNILIQGSDKRPACLTLGGLGDKEAESFNMDLIVTGNILHGPVAKVWTGEVWTKNITCTDNIYQSVPKNFTPGKGDRVEPDLAKLLKDVKNHDYTRR